MRRPRAAAFLGSALPLIAAVFFVSLAHRADAAWAERVTARTTCEGTGSTVNCQFGGAVMAGDLLRACVTNYGGYTFTSASDDLNGAWSPEEDNFHEASHQQYSRCFYRANSQAGTPTVSFVMSNSVGIGGQMTAYSGLATQNVLVDEAVTNFDAGQLYPVCAAVTPTEAGQLIAGAIGIYYDATIEPDDGETEIYDNASFQIEHVAAPDTNDFQISWTFQGVERNPGCGVGVYALYSPVPGWTVEPTWTKVDHDTIRATFNASNSPPNTVKCGAYPWGAAKPSAEDVAAGTGAHGTASASATGSTQTLDINVTDNPAFPGYRAFCVQDNNGTLSGVPNSSDTMLDPPTGFQYVGPLITITTAGSVPYLYDNAGFTNVPYDTKTVNFTLDKLLMDRTSGAWGFIRADSGSNLIVDVRAGTFANNDVLADNAGGAALVNGSSSALSPLIAIGDILVEPVGMSPAADGQSCPAHPACLFFDTEGSFSYMANGRQRAMNGVVYHAATASYLPIDADLVINNHAPVGTPTLVPQVMRLGVIYTMNLNDLVTDLDGDTVQFAWVSGSLPPFTLSSAGIFTGNPATEHETGVDLQFVFYDADGDAYVQAFKAVPIESWTLASCVGGTFEACRAAIRNQTFNSVTVAQTASLCSVGASTAVLTQNPAAGNEVVPGDTVSTTVSAGHARLCAAALKDQGE